MEEADTTSSDKVDSVAIGDTETAAVRDSRTGNSGSRKRKSDRSDSSVISGVKKKKSTKEQQSVGASINESPKETNNSASDKNKKKKLERKSKKPKKVVSTNKSALESTPGPSAVQVASTDQQPSQSRQEEGEVMDVDGCVKEASFQQLPACGKFNSRNSRQTKKEKIISCPKCNKAYTSMKRFQSHYDEQTQTCKYEDKKQLCPLCGNTFFNLQDHYDEETKTCKKTKDCSLEIVPALAEKKLSEEELYALISEDTPDLECNVVWRRILKQFKVLKCQNKNCNHRSNSVTALRYHIERCGKATIQLSCPVCQKCYTTKPGLDYHMSTKHQPQQEESAELNSEEIEVTMSKRQAAVKAAVNLAKVSTDKPAIDLRSIATDEQPHNSSVDDAEISKAEWAAIRNAFKNNKEVKCLSAHCTLKFKSLSGFKYHISRCTETKTLECAICKKKLTTWQRFQNHMLKIHNIGEEACIDNEYMIPKQLVAASSDEEDAVLGKQNSLPKRIYNKYTLDATYQQQLKKLVDELTSAEELFTDWQPSLKSWARCDPRDCPQYAPVASHSVRFCFANSETDTSPLSQLTLFDAAHEDAKYGMTAGVIFNVGGPVWSVGWAPYGEEPPCNNVQYVAMAAHRTLDETHRMDTPLKHKGLIQLWSVAIGDQAELPRLSLGIAHEYGCIWSMKWCPSGCAAKLKSTIDCSEVMSRLGLLALACSDGVVRILCIPYPDELLERLSPVTQDVSNSYDMFVIPKSVCCLLSPGNIASQSNFSALYGQCLDIEWLPRQPHNKIAASFSNGTVAIWDLLTNSWLLKGSLDYCDAVFYPQQHLSSTHMSNVCRSISWCADDPDYLFTGGYDKWLCLWDLKSPEEPVERWDRGWCLDSSWPLLCPGVFCLEDCTAKVKNLSFQEFNTGKSVSIIRSLVPQISFSYCQWRNTVAFGTVTGDLAVKRFPPYIHFYRRPKHGGKRNPQVLCFSARMCDVREETDESLNESTANDSSSSTTGDKCMTFYNYPQENEHQLEYSPDMDPTTAVIKVAWNPHQQHCDWLLVATNAGLVRLLKHGGRT